MSPRVQLVLYMLPTRLKKKLTAQCPNLFPVHIFLSAISSFWSYLHSLILVTRWRHMAKNSQVGHNLDLFTARGLDNVSSSQKAIIKYLRLMPSLKKFINKIFDICSSGKGFKKFFCSGEPKWEPISKWRKCQSGKASQERPACSSSAGFTCCCKGQCSWFNKGTKITSEGEIEGPNFMWISNAKSIKIIFIAKMIRCILLGSWVEERTAIEKQQGFISVHFDIKCMKIQS